MAREGRVAAAEVASPLYGEWSFDSGIGIFDGDLLIIDRSRTAEPGEVVVAAVNGESLVKILDRVDGVVGLRSANAAYGLIKVREGDELDVWGVVRWSVRKHGRY